LKIGGAGKAAHGFSHILPDCQLFGRDIFQGQSQCLIFQVASKSVLFLAPSISINNSQKRRIAAFMALNLPRLEKALRGSEC
jgi:hypothetical protein